MATTTNPQVSAENGGNPATVGGGITRLNASDGLFLRAEHLNTMEDYSLELSRAVGVAAGNGVVYGYGVKLDQKTLTLKVEAGLAIGPDGRPLQSTMVAELDISNLTATGDGFYVVELAPADWLFGQENVYGNLCTDPCSQGGQIQPYQAEGIAISVVPDTMQGLAGQNDNQMRNWLASAYYEREREQAAPWLVPSLPNKPVPHLDSDAFSSSTGRPGGVTVPLAVLVPLKSGLKVDQWIARRDIGDPVPRRAWQWRLAMRPWDVFIAQVLQFQAQFNDEYQTAQQQSAQTGTAGEITEAIKGLQRGLDRQHVKAGWLQAGLDKLAKAAEEVAEANQTGLLGLGFNELPPAGYLPAADSKSDVASHFSTMFGSGVELRIRYCRADYAVRAVEQAQHLDRIPLDLPVQQDKPRVDVLVPSEPADLSALYTASYPWVAFVRRSKPDHRPRIDEVAVYLLQMRGSKKGAKDTVERILKGEHPHGMEHMGQLAYPAGAYAVPTPDIYDAIHTKIGHFKKHWMIAVGLASAEDRQPLAAVRAFLLALGMTVDETLDVAEVLVGYPHGLSQEAIVIVYGSGEGGTGFLAEQTAGSPAEQAAGSPAEEAAGSPAEQATGSPAGQAAGSPAEEAAGSPAEQATGSPAGQAAESPAEEAAGSPAEQGTGS
jgi:hypothetical protein